MTSAQGAQNDFGALLETQNFLSQESYDAFIFNLIWLEICNSWHPVSPNHYTVQAASHLTYHFLHFPLIL